VINYEFWSGGLHDNHAVAAWILRTISEFCGLAIIQMLIDFYSTSQSGTLRPMVSRPVGQSVLVSNTHLGPAIKFSPFSVILRWSRFSQCGAPSLTRGRVCSFQLLVFASTVFLGSESRGTNEHILLPQFLRLPQPGVPGSCMYFPQEQGRPVIPPSIGFSAVEELL
jgi:hypothetical protein